MGIKTLLIGRHQGDPIPNYDIVRQSPITWATDPDRVCNQIATLEQDALDAGIEHILLQNMPATLAAAWPQAFRQGVFRRPWSIVVSVPGERPAGVVEQRSFDDVLDAEACADLVRAANPNAKITVFPGDFGEVSVQVTVDPPMKFVFSHVAPLVR